MRWRMLWLDAEQQRRRCRRQRIINRVVPDRRDEQLKQVSEAVHHKAHPVLVFLHVACNYVARRVFNAKVVFLVLTIMADIPQQRLVAVENAESASRHTLHDLELGLQNSLAAAEILNVCSSDVCDDRNVRLCNAGQVFHLTEVVHAHLQHRDLRPLGNTHDAHRQAEVIVLITLGARRLEAPLQHARRHFLRRCLADASGDADDLDPKELAIACGNAAVGAHCIVHDKTWQRRFHRMLNDRSHRAVFLCGGNVVMSVRMLSLEGDEQVSRRDCARIRFHTPDRKRLRAVRRLCAAPRGDLAQSQFFHDSFSKYSATISRSSMWCFSCPTS